MTNTLTREILLVGGFAHGDFYTIESTHLLPETVTISNDAGSKAHREQYQLGNFTFEGEHFNVYIWKRMSDVAAKKKLAELLANGIPKPKTKG